MSLKNIPSLLYEEFSQYCGGEREFESRYTYVPYDYKIRRVSRVKAEATFPGSDGIIIGLSYSLSFEDKEESAFSVWVGGYLRRLRPYDSEFPSLIISSGYSKIYTDKYIVTMCIGDKMILSPFSSPFIAEIIQKSAWLVKKYTTIKDDL